SDTIRKFFQIFLEGRIFQSFGHHPLQIRIGCSLGEAGGTRYCQAEASEQDHSCMRFAHDEALEMKAWRKAKETRPGRRFRWNKCFVYFFRSRRRIVSSTVLPAISRLFGLSLSIVS